MSETKYRIISAGLMLPLVVVFIWVDSIFIDIAFYFCSTFLLAKEFHLFTDGGLTRKDTTLSFFFVALTSALQIIFVHVEDFRKYFSSMDQILVFSMAIQILVFILIHLFRQSFERLYFKLQTLVFVLFFTNFFLSFCLKLKYFSVLFSDSTTLAYLYRDIDFLDNFYLLYLMMSVWLYDSAAFFGGKFFGRKKLGMAVSPNKTWAGLCVGFLLSPVSFFVVGRLIYWSSEEIYERSFFSNILLGIFVSVLLAVVAQFGDLIASLIKRSVGIKNSGNFMKGHGGFFDRVDSLLPTFFFFYYFLIFYYNYNIS